jgi:outer membrane cobalamin receptor
LTLRAVVWSLCLIVLICFGLGQRQGETPKHTLSGYVKDSLSGESLIGATIVVKELPNTGTTVNSYGFFSLTIPEGSYTITAFYIGYDPKSFSISLNKSEKLTIELTEKAVQQQEVVVGAEKFDDNVKETQMGVEKMDVKSLQLVPVLFGEKDVMKTIQLLPGVETASEGGSGFYVRGGNSDQNLILLDEATVYNASHLLGFFSVFNSDAVNDVTLYKGAAPAEYGGRLSSVLDIKMKDGNDKGIVVDGGIGLIASRLSVEGPLGDNGSFAVFGRRTYADLFLKLSRDTTINRDELYFDDFNAKANYRLGENDRVFVSGYFGADVLGFGSALGINWGNTTGTLRWNHLFNDRLFSNTSLIYSKYDYQINSDLAGNNLTLYSSIQDFNFKQDFQYFADESNAFKFGFNSVVHRMIPGTVTSSNGTQESITSLTNKYSWENALYVAHDYKASPVLSFDYGLRLTAFSIIGPGAFSTYDSAGDALDTLNLGSGDYLKTYVNLEPRFSANYSLDTTSSLKVSYGRSVQNLHLISNSNASNPTDLWIPSSNNVHPEIADQVSFGWFKNFEDNMFEFSAETYFKYMQNTIDYKDGAQLIFNENIESQLLYGHGRAYGLELFLKKKYGDVSGWVGYTLSRSEIQIPGINNGDYYPARQDRTHDISVVGMYQLNTSWSLSATFVYYTGDAVTFPSGKYEVDGLIANYYTERNGYRMPAYNRLDLGATWQGERSSWNFSLYNAYGRENAYTITFEKDPDDPSKTEALQTSLFRFVPSVTYNFKF